MKKTEVSLTPEEIDAIRQELAEHSKAHGVTLRDLKRAIGRSETTFSQFLSGQYRGNNVDLAIKVRAYLDLEREKAAAPLPEGGFVMTDAAHRVFETARFCHSYGQIGVLTGLAGLGKTESAKEYTRRNPSTIMIEVDPGVTTGVLFSKIHKALGGTGKGRLHDLFEDIVALLDKSQRLLILDEAEHLPYRGLEMLRRLHDKCQIGLLLIGMPRLLNNIVGRVEEYGQLYSRVGIAVSVEALTEDDSLALVNSILPQFVEHAKTLHDVTAGNARALTKLLPQVQRTARINGRQISAELIRETGRRMLILRATR